VKTFRFSSLLTAFPVSGEMAGKSQNILAQLFTARFRQASAALGLQGGIP